MQFKQDAWKEPIKHEGRWQPNPLLLNPARCPLELVKHSISKTKQEGMILEVLFSPQSEITALIALWTWRDPRGKTGAGAHACQQSTHQMISFWGQSLSQKLRLAEALHRQETVKFTQESNKTIGIKRCQILEKKRPIFNGQSKMWALEANCTVRKLLSDEFCFILAVRLLKGCAIKCSFSCQNLILRVWYSQTRRHHVEKLCAKKALAFISPSLRWPRI